MSAQAINIQGLSVSYEQKRILTNIFLEIEKGHLYGVIGPNGAGKSTLFKSILGLTPIDSGTITINGGTIQQSRKSLVYVPQKIDIDWSFPTTVFDVVLMGRYPHKAFYQSLDAKDRKMALDALEETGITHLKNRQIGELSGGQQQRVFIARALCQQADILMLDEPFVGIDTTTEDRIIQILKKLAKEGKTILVVHHDLGSVVEYFDKVILLNQRLIACGDVFTTFTDENIAKAYRSELPILHQVNTI